MNPDISQILDEWGYTGPDELSVRKIVGVDGQTRIQMRVDLGILQMEWSGRPDGQKPYGKSSFLNYFREKLEDQEGPDTQNMLSRNDCIKLQKECDEIINSKWFKIEDCIKLQKESLQYYYRRICMFELEAYTEAFRDAEHNLEIMDLVKQFAENETDQLSFEQYRPFVIMHRTRARSLIAKENKNKALDYIEEGIKEITNFFRSYDREDLLKESQEIITLREMAEKLKKSNPKSQEEKLRVELTVAVENENFEQAAEIRDTLKKLRLS